MNKINPIKLILSNVLAALAIFTFLIWMAGDGFNFPSAIGQTPNLMAGNVGVEYDNTVFNITDVSIKYDEVWGPTMIGLIENRDPVNTIEGVSLSVQMYDENNHLIGVMKGYPQSSNILPNQKTAFEIQSGDEDIRNIDHVFIEILATDWGDSLAYAEGNDYRPYIGIVGLNLTPDVSKGIGLNQTQGILITSIDEGSPAEKGDLQAGSTVKMFNGREINTGGDVILKIDNKTVSDMYDIMRHFQTEKRVGDNVTLTILRDNVIKELDLTLGPTPSQDKIDSSTSQNKNVSYVGIVGITTALSPDYSRIGTNQTEGVLITDITKGSPAEKYGLKSGTMTINGKVGADIILKIDNQSVSNIEDITTYVAQKQPGNKIHLTILRDNTIKELDLILGQMPYQPTSQNSDSNYPEELYDECVSVAGKSFCDFLFRR